MNRCAVCGLTRSQLLSHWRRVNGVNNPRECAKQWYAAGYSFNSWHPELNSVSGCMSNEIFGMTGDPYYFGTAQYDSGRRAKGYNEN